MSDICSDSHKFTFSSLCAEFWPLNRFLSAVCQMSASGHVLQLTAPPHIHTLVVPLINRWVFTKPLHLPRWPWASHMAASEFQLSSEASHLLTENVSELREAALSLKRHGSMSQCVRVHVEVGLIVLILSLPVFFCLLRTWNECSQNHGSDLLTNPSAVFVFSNKLFYKCVKTVKQLRRTNPSEWYRLRGKKNKKKKYWSNLFFFLLSATTTRLCRNHFEEVESDNFFCVITWRWNGFWEQIGEFWG